MDAVIFAFLLVLLPNIGSADDKSDAVKDYGEDPETSDRGITYKDVWLPVGLSKAQWVHQNGMEQKLFAEVLELVKQYKENEAVALGLTVTDADRDNFDVYVERSVMTKPQIEQRLIEQKERLDALKAEAAGGGKRRKKRAAINFERGSGAKAKWVGNVIPYKFDGKQEPQDIKMIYAAMEHIASQTVLQFKELLAADRYDEQHLLFTAEDTGCFSYVGKTSVLNDHPQQVNLQPALCTSHLAIPVHEICHAAGLWHEQARSDSTEHIEVLIDKIKMEYLTQFARRGRLSSNTYGVAFDEASAMHYPSKEFGKVAGDVTLQTKNKLYQSTIGQRVSLSFYDAKLINKIYGDGICAVELACANRGYTDPKDCSKCRCPEGFGGTLCDTVAPGNGTCFPTSSSEIVLTNTDPVCVNTNDFENGGWYPLRSSCNWHVSAYEGCTIDMWFEGNFGLYCLEHEPSCMHWIEIKYKGDLALRGPRFCCYSPPDLGPEGKLTTESNKAVITFSSQYPLAISRRSYIPTRPERRGFKLCFQISNDECYTPPPPKGCGEWGLWKDWSPCTKRCGGCGVQRRSRVCIDPNYHRAIQSHFRVCNKGLCPENGKDFYRPAKRDKKTNELIISSGLREALCCYDFRKQRHFPIKALLPAICSDLGGIIQP